MSREICGECKWHTYEEKDRGMKWEEFKEKQRELNKPRDLMTMAECPKCGDYLYQQQGIVLTSYPPQHIYYCKKCGWSGTA